MKKKKLAIYAATAFAAITVGTIGSNQSAKEPLQDLIGTEIQEAVYYTPLTYQDYSIALDYAISVSDDLFAGEDEIDSAYEELKNRIDGLQPVPDKTDLRNLYQQCISIDYSLYIPRSTESLQTQVIHALAVLDDPNAIVEDVSQSVDHLNSALGGLIETPDKSRLISILETANAIDTSIYLPKSYQSLQKAVSLAEDVLNNENAVETDVTEAISGISGALDSLIPKPDKSTLLDTIEKAISIDETRYTTASYSAFQKILPSVQATASNENATQEQVSSAEAKLNDALDELVISTHGIYKINIRFQNESNNHVGNSWDYWASYDGNDIDGALITVRHDSTISIYCKIVEDDSIPDIGSGYLSLSMRDGAENSLHISVYENRGRYSGNRAVWIVRASATLIERV